MGEDLDPVTEHHDELEGPEVPREPTAQETYVAEADKRLIEIRVEFDQLADEAGLSREQRERMWYLVADAYEKGHLDSRGGDEDFVDANIAANKELQNQQLS